MNTRSCDVVILGAGLAGLTLARQLRQDSPDLDIAIIERNRFPVPRTTNKVGESTVEIGAHYLSETLNLQEHFERHHLSKNGLRCFFGKSQPDFSGQDELGVSELFGIPTYQLERGVLENHLHDSLKSAGVNFIEGASCSEISIGKKAQRAHVNASAQGEIKLEARWMVDAAGRQAIVKKHLGLNTASAHKGNAVWFRIDKTIRLDQWSDNEKWQSRLACKGKRWLSTNHLMGPGYWVWIIPLGSGATSIGIVMDDQALEESGICQYEDALRWLEREQPRCFEAIGDATPLDFCKVQDYSLDSKQFFSDQGWALSGEAGAFADPFYSPGSDFIALNNTFIADLIKSEKKDEDIRLKSAVYNKLTQSFFQNTLSLFTNQYGGFGDRKMMSLKLLWDYAYYWGVLSLLSFGNITINLDAMRSVAPELIQAQALNKNMQQRFVDRAKKRIVLPASGLFFNQFEVPCLHHFHETLRNRGGDCALTSLRDNVQLMNRLAPMILDMLSDHAAVQISIGERELLGDYRVRVLA